MAMEKARKGELDDPSRYSLAKELNTALRTYKTERNPSKATAAIRSLTQRRALRVAMMGLTEKNIGVLIRYFLRFLDRHGFVKPTLEAVHVFVELYGSKVDRFSERNLSLYFDLIEKIIDELDFCKRFIELQNFSKELLEEKKKTNMAILMAMMSTMQTEE